jgi:predicted acyl esterase
MVFPYHYNSLCVWASTHAQNSQDSLWFRQNYTKKEVMIPMRDGIKLFTSIYIPKDLVEAHLLLCGGRLIPAIPMGRTNMPSCMTITITTIYGITI